MIFQYSIFFNILLFQSIESIRNPLLVHIAEQGRSTSTESYIYRHRLITRSTSTSIANLANQDFHSTTSFLNYYQPAPTLINREPTQNLTEIVCPRQKNVHRNCQRSCQGSNQNTNCRHQRICACDHNCGFSCLSRSVINEPYLCPVLSNPPHGRIHYEGHSFYSHLKYECNPGYTVVGPQERICVSDGFWEPVADVYCIRKDEVCTIDGTIENGQYTPIQQVYYPDQQIRIECNMGYELDRLSPVQTCQKDGTWLPIDTPKCLRSPCGEPPSIPNGYLVNTTTTYAQYACFSRFLLRNGVSRIECNHGRWQSLRPQCVEASCPHPNNEGFNGFVLSTRSTFLVGDGTTLACNSSTRSDLIPPNEYVVCDSYGQWKPKLPRCYEKCRLPDLGKNFLGYYIDDDTNDWYGKELQPGAYVRHEQSIRYQCRCTEGSDYNCSSDRPILNQCIDGVWSLGGPHCAEDARGECSIPANIPHVMLINGTKASYLINESESFEYDCTYGYARMTNVSCIHGRLSALPRCEPRNCTTHPYWIKNGYVKYQNRRHGGHAKYSCRNGYRLNNLRVLRCLFGQWESPYDRNNLVQCVADPCLHPGFIKNGKTYVINYGTSRYILSANASLRHGASLEFVCDPGFMLLGNRGSTCFSGIWRPDQLPICVADRHVTLQHVLHKYVSKG